MGTVVTETMVGSEIVSELEFSPFSLMISCQGRISQTVGTWEGQIKVLTWQNTLALFPSFAPLSLEGPENRVNVTHSLTHLFIPRFIHSLSSLQPSSCRSSSSSPSSSSPSAGSPASRGASRPGRVAMWHDATLTLAEITVCTCGEARKSMDR